MRNKNDSLCGASKRQSPLSFRVRVVVRVMDSFGVMVRVRVHGITSHILALRRILEGARQRNLPAAMVFVDFKKALDSLHRGILMWTLKAYGIPDSIVDCGYH